MDFIRHITYIEKAWYKIKVETGDRVQGLLFRRPHVSLWACHNAGLQVEETGLYLDCWEHECIFKDGHTVIMGSVYTHVRHVH